MIFAILIHTTTAFATERFWRTEGNVIRVGDFAAAKKSCAADLDPTGAGVRAKEPYARLLFESVIDGVDAIDPSRAHLRVDVCGQIWDWSPDHDRSTLRIRFARDGEGRAVRALVTRPNYLQDLIVTSPERVHGLEAELERRRPAARVTIEADRDALASRPIPTAGILL